jgi:hypothetical protein
MSKSELQTATGDELRAAIEKGKRTIRALEAGNLADMRVAAHYPDGGSDAVLDRNFDQIQRVRAAVGRVSAELASRGESQ